MENSFNMTKKSNRQFLKLKLTICFLLLFFNSFSQQIVDWVITDNNWEWQDASGNWVPVGGGDVSCFSNWWPSGMPFTGGGSQPIWSTLGNPYQTVRMRQSFNYLCEGITDSIYAMADDQSQIFINGVFIGATTTWQQLFKFQIPKGILRLNTVNQIEIIGIDRAAGCWFAAARVFSSNPMYRDSFEKIQNDCKLKVDYSAPCNETRESDACLFSNFFGDFNFIYGKSPFPIIISDYNLVKVDSSFNFDCKQNNKEYSLKYNNSVKGDILLKISVDCSCTPPECPPPTKVNPYLNNLAGNWQATNSYAYNTKRVSNDPNQTRKGETFTSYNSIMNHNGSYWSMDDNANWISKETNTLIDFNGQSVESTNPLKIPSSAKLSFKNALTNHVTSNASSQETFFLSNEDDNMFKSANGNIFDFYRDKFSVSEIELPLLPKSNIDWPYISNHWHKNISRLEQSKDEFHTGTNSLKVLPKSVDTGYAYTQYFTCESQFQTNNGGIMYCHSEPIYNTELDINKVIFGTINNSSTCGSLTGSQGIAQGTANKYSNFSKSSVPVPMLNKGQLYNITVDFNKCGSTKDGFCYVYFDWNQDGDFEDQGEKYGLKEVLNNTLTVTKPIIIPANALVGKTRMRVSYQVGAVTSLLGYNLPVSGIPCANNLLNSYGEVEDYTINVLDKYEVEASKQTYTITTEDVRINEKSIVNEFSLQKDKDYLLSYWVKDNKASTSIGYIDVLDNGLAKIVPIYPTRPMNIEGWHKIEKVFRVSTNKFKMVFFPTPNSSTATYFDDIRIQPLDASMKGYVYDELTQRLVSELDENNFATFYDYDEEGQLVRVRKETERGIMTIKESRKSLKQ